MRTLSRIKLKHRNRILINSIPGQENYDEYVPDDAKNPKAPYGKIFKRADWGALPPVKSDGILSLPVMYVNTVCAFMEADEGGIREGVKGPEAVRWFQREDLAAGLSDIRSSFIIDEDGMIYEGRGWKEKPAIIDQNHPNRYMEYLEICYLGDFSKEAINHPAHYATVKLMDIGKRNCLVSRDALLLPPKGAYYERKEVKIPKYFPTN